MSTCLASVASAPSPFGSVSRIDGKTSIQPVLQEGPESPQILGRVPLPNVVVRRTLDPPVPLRTGVRRVKGRPVGKGNQLVSPCVAEVNGHLHAGQLLDG